MTWPAIKGGLAPRQLRRILVHIDEHLADKLLTRNLAAVVGLAPHYFSHAFKASTGLPPHRYIADQRIRRAQHLLQHTRRPIADIAGLCGFSSQSHFTQIFRHATGLPPAQFRRRLAGR